MLIKDIIYIIFNESDASIKQTIVNLGKHNSIIFNLGIPIAGVHIESNTNGSTDYDDFVEIWYNENNKIYYIGIRGLSENKYYHKSDVSTAIIFYI